MDPRILKVCELLVQAEEEPSLNEMASLAGLSPAHLQKVFLATTGLSPKNWYRSERALRVRSALQKGLNVTDAMFEAGYNSSGRFYEESTEVLGMTPREFLKGGPEVEIRFAVAQSSLGAVLIAQSEKGICSISLGDDPEELIQELEKSFPNASLIGKDPVFEAHVAAVISFVENPKVGLNLPLDIRGTVFQKRVWNTLRQIPPGQTVTYSELAHKIRMPKAARAVASACAANRIAIAIPCHRVIRTDGSLSGYRWGVDRKRRLIIREQQF